MCNCKKSVIHGGKGRKIWSYIMQKVIHKTFHSSEVCVAQCCTSLRLIRKRYLANEPLTSTTQSVHYASMKFLDTDHKTGCVCQHVVSVGWGQGGRQQISEERVKYSDFKLSRNISTLTKNITNTVRTLTSLIFIDWSRQIQNWFLQLTQKHIYQSDCY